MPAIPDAPPCEPTDSDRLPRLVALGACLLSVALAGVYLTQIDDAPWFRSLILDEAAYSARAHAILAGDWLLTGEGIFYQDPLFPYILALWYALTGSSTWGAHLLQLLLAPVVCALTYALGRALMDARIGAVASVLAALYLPFYFFGGLLHKALPATAIFTAALIVLTRARGRLVQLGVAGMLLGLCALLRGNFLAVIPIAAIAAAWPTARKNTGESINRRRWNLQAGGALLLGSALVILPVTLRNYVIGRDVVLVTFQGGPNLYIGNHPGNITGTYQAPSFVRATPEKERDDFSREAVRRAGKPLTPSGVNSFWYRETARYVWAHPGEALRNALAKAFLLIATGEVSDNIPYSFYRDRYAYMLRLPLLAFGIVFPFAALGMMAWWRNGHDNNRRRTRIALLLTGTYAVTLCLSYVVGRYRLPIIPVALVWAAVGMQHLWTLAHDTARRATRFIVPLLLIASVAGVSHLPLQTEHRDAPYYVMGNMYVRRGDIAAARQEYAVAIAINPQHVHALLNLGWTYYNDGDWMRAQSYFERALAARAEYPNVHLALAMTAYQQGATDQALAHLRSAADLGPIIDERVAQNGVALARRLGDADLARRFEMQRAP